MNSYDWIVNDLAKSIVLVLIHNEKDNTGLFEASSLVDEVGNEISVNGDNINDLLNFINSSFVRFKSNKLSFENSEDFYIDIPLRNISTLYNSADIIMITKEKVIVNNSIIPISQLEAFSILDGFLLGDTYGIRAVSFYDDISSISIELEKLLDIINEFPRMTMENRYYALHELYNINMKRELLKTEKNSKI